MSEGLIVRVERPQSVCRRLGFAAETVLPRQGSVWYDADYSSIHYSLGRTKWISALPSTTTRPGTKTSCCALPSKSGYATRTTLQSTASFFQISKTNEKSEQFFCGFTSSGLRQSVASKSARLPICHLISQTNVRAGCAAQPRRTGIRSFKVGRVSKAGLSLPPQSEA